MSRGLNDAATQDQLRVSVQKDLASGGQPVPRYAAEAILSHMDEPSKWLLYGGLGLASRRTSGRSRCTWPATPPGTRPALRW
jgi:hypothetical protein